MYLRGDDHFEAITSQFELISHQPIRITHHRFISTISTYPTPCSSGEHALPSRSTPPSATPSSPQPAGTPPTSSSPSSRPPSQTTSLAGEVRARAPQGAHLLPDLLSGLLPLVHAPARQHRLLETGRTVSSSSTHVGSETGPSLLLSITHCSSAHSLVFSTWPWIAASLASPSIMIRVQSWKRIDSITAQVTGYDGEGSGVHAHRRCQAELPRSVVDEANRPRQHTLLRKASERLIFSSRQHLPNERAQESRHAKGAARRIPRLVQRRWVCAATTSTRSSTRCHPWSTTNLSNRFSTKCGSSKNHLLRQIHVRRPILRRICSLQGWKPASLSLPSGRSSKKKKKIKKSG